MDEQYYIYKKDGTKIKIGGTTANPIYLSIRKVQYDGTFLGRSHISFSLKSPIPIPFEGQEYTVIDDERYTLKYIPSFKKQARKKEYGESFVYDNIIMQSQIDDTTRVAFLDYVLEDNTIHYSAMPTVYFYGTVKDLAMRIQANLDRVFTDDEKWTVVLPTDTSTLPTTEKQITYQNKKVWDVITDIWNQYKVMFYSKGRSLYIGYSEDVISHNFMYGIGKGLKSLKRNTDENNEIITRLHAYGSTLNLPNRYYNTLGTTVKADLPVDIASTVGDGVNKKIWFKIKDAPMDMFMDTSNFSFTGSGPSGDATDSYTTKTVTFTATKVVKSVSEGTYLYIDCSSWTYNDYKWLYYAMRTSGAVATVTTGVVVSYIPDVYLIGSKYVNESMYLPNLMLPAIRISGNVTIYYDENFNVVTDSTKAYYRMVKVGDGSKGLDIYLDSIKGIETYGILEGNIIFDNNSDSNIIDLVDDESGIHPTLTKLTNADGGSACKIISATQMTDSGIPDASGKLDISTFTLTINPGFNPNVYVISGETPQISMKSGTCIGRSFEYNCSADNSGNYALICNRVIDSATNYGYPNKDYNIQAGDTYVFTGIELPDAYIQSAENRLLSAGLHYLAKFDHTQNTYTPELDDIFLEHNKTVRSELRVGKLFRFTDSEINGVDANNTGISLSIPITQLTIKIGESDIREHSITLADSPNISSSSVQRALKSVGSELATTYSNTGYNWSGIIANLKDIFLSKTIADAASSVITFAQGIVSKAKSYFTGGISVTGGIATDTQAVGDEDNTTTECISAVYGRQDAHKAFVNTSVQANLFTDETITDTDYTTLGATWGLIIQKLAKVHGLTVEDTANILKLIVTGSIASESFSSGLTGTGFRLEKDGNLWGLELDDITVRRTMTIFELLISKIRSVNGGIVISQGNGTIESVVSTETVNNHLCYICTIKHADGELDNPFSTGDFVRYQHFKRNSGGGNSRYYTGYVTDNPVDGADVKIEFYVADGTSTPQAGDELVQFGNDTDTTRQGLLYLTSADGHPRIETLNGVNSATWSGLPMAQEGDLSTINDSDFGGQLSGYGLYGQNVYLKGMFVLKSSGKTMEDTMDSKITANNSSLDAVYTKTTDFNSYKTTVTNDIKVSADGLDAKISTNKGNISSLSTKVDGISTKVTTAQGDISTLQQRADTIETDVQNNTGDISTLQQTATSLSLKVGSIGATNLLTGTRNWTGWTKVGNIYVQTDKYNGLTVLGTTTSFAYYSQKFAFVQGKTYTLSAYVKAGVAVKVGCFTFSGNGEGVQTISPSDGWTKWTWTFTVDGTTHKADTDHQTVAIQFFATDGSSAFSSAAYICGMMLVVGNASIDWAENPTDTGTELLATGVDIEKKRIDLTADKTRFLDNSGNVLGIFDNDGLTSKRVNCVNSANIKVYTINETGDGTCKRYYPDSGKKLSEESFSFVNGNCRGMVTTFYNQDGSVSYQIDYDGTLVTDPQGFTSTRCYANANITDAALKVKGALTANKYASTYYSNQTNTSKYNNRVAVGDTPMAYNADIPINGWYTGYLIALFAFIDRADDGTVTYKRSYTHYTDGVADGSGTIDF
jgi:hypothetical protein